MTAEIGWAKVYAMAAAAGIAVANNYYNQPMLVLIQSDLSPRLAGFVPTVTQLGYAAGLFLLVPLGDIVEKRALVGVHYAMLSVALVLAAVAPTAEVLLAASFVVGSASSTAQQLVALAAQLVAPKRRGATVGTVLAGILTGILLSRTLAGVVAAHAGWREMFWLGAPLSLLAGLAMMLILPRVPPTTRLGYGALIGSLAGLWREFPPLRRAVVTQSLVFACFSVFWTTLALRLAAPPFGLGPEVAGLFGIVGLSGIFAAPLAGRMADRRGAGLVVMASTALVLAAWAVFGLSGSLIGIAVGVVLLDLGVQSSLVGHQQIVFGLRPEARSRLNTILVGTMFLGGAAGSAAAALLWASHGWTGVVLLGLAAGMGAAATGLRR